MPLLFDELFTCPNCEIIFQAKILGVYNSFGERYSDLYIAAEEEPQPILLQINLCPKCGFAAYTADFKTFDIELLYVRDAIKAIEKYSGRPATEFNPGDGYLEMAEYLGRTSLENKIFFTLQAIYSYRELEDVIITKTRRHLLKMIKAILKTKDYQTNPEEFFLYLAGELHRLLGEQDQSLAYFEKAIALAPKDSIISRITQYQLTTPNEIIPKKIFGR
ncbi:MAG: DUF2225 domain-containing protein [Candidatus Heimdallarchaeota archaeon]